MAAIYIPEEYGNVVFQWQRDGQLELQTCTMGIRNVGNATPWQDIVDDIYDGVTASGGLCEAGFMDTNWSFQGVKMYYRESAVDPIYAVEHIDPVNGTYAPANYQSPPNNIAVVVRKRCAPLGKKYRGRMYVPAFHCANTGISPGGILDSIYVDQYQTAVDFLLVLGLGAADGFQLLHSEEGLPPTSLTSLVVSPAIGTQRRRFS